MQGDGAGVVLYLFAEILGGARALSDRLQVPMADLTRWLAGADRRNSRFHPTTLRREPKPKQ
jgi:hypothetical protein